MTTNKTRQVQYDVLPVIGNGKANERSGKGGRAQQRRIDKDAENWPHGAFLRGTDGRDSALYGPDAIREEP